MKRNLLRKVSILTFVGFLGMGIFQSNHFTSVAAAKHVNKPVVHVKHPHPSPRDPIWPERRH
ncbi:hypothetical protein [Priestia koreensis]|uniref:hypothetical protein n=1 Tax=Priestia koreensis TaxID=284581 RepID=UPI0020416B90|nr:hypothetical protein [Priestia koreensis]MCM3006865.1 hypothetical protein [Priestia koreensis]